MSKYSELVDRLGSLYIIDEVGSNNTLAKEAAAALRELEAENERLRERRTEIDDEAFRYAEQVEILRALLWEWMSTQEDDEPVTPELLERTDAALEGE